MNHKKEILRYLGAVHSNSILDGMIDRAQKEVEAAARPRHLFQLFPISVDAAGIAVSGTRLESRSLSEHLQGCQEAFFFALTLGPGIDALIRRASVAEPSYVPVLQACAAEYVEACADNIQKEMEQKAKERGLFLRPRYSPGYGDFPLSCQRFFFDALAISKKIGISLTENFLMIPLKSITAIIGLSSDSSLCHVGKCMMCQSKNCPFRKESEQ